MPPSLPAVHSRVLLFTYCLLAVVAAGAQNSVPSPVISILEKDGNPRINPATPPPYLDTLESLGLRVAFPDAARRAPLTWDRLRQFNMLIMTSFTQEHAGTSALVVGEGDRSAPLLDRYLQEGGGILYIGQQALASVLEHDDLNAWLEQYGAQFDWAVVHDEAHTYKTPPPVPWQRPSYQWTTNIAASPVTQGVRTLFYQNGWWYSPVLRPLQVSEDWQVLVSSMPTAQTWPLTKPLPNAYCTRKIGEETTGARALIAVRQVGKGRLALFGADPGPFYYDLSKPVLGQVSASRGDGERTSDWLPLLRNLCVWLSEPARAAGFPGGSTERAQFFVNPEYGNRNPIDWERPDAAISDAELTRLYAMHSSMWKEDDWRALIAGDYRAYRFLVGAHSVRSGGKGTVAEWRAAAQEAGYDGVIFREQILSMTQQQWEAFEQECRAASDESFYAVPGQEFEDWEGNRFMRYNQHIPYGINPERLTEDGKRVKLQLSFFFDVGWPANFPIFSQRNPTPYWNWRVYSAFPVAVYQGGRQIEDNTAEWEALVDRNEWPSPIAVHLLEDPSEVAATVNDHHLLVLAPSLRDMQTNPRWQRSIMGTGLHNSFSAYVSNGPVIDAFQALNMYRTTLGSREVPGSYRYRVYVRAHSDVPIERVELWGGGQCLRRYRPNQKEVLLSIDELHDRQRGLFLRVVDAEGREALGTSVLVHDKMMVFGWCGDHCNVLPGGTGLDEQGNPAAFAGLSHPKSILEVGGGPGTSISEMGMYVPYGTDTSAPPLGIQGLVSLVGEQSVLPAPHMHLVPDVRLHYATRDLIIIREAVDRWADLNKYSHEVYTGIISGWGPYFTTQSTEDFDLIADDIDFQRDAGRPALQLCRGEVRFKREVTLSATETVNLVLGQVRDGVVQQGLYTAQGRVAQPGTLSGLLGKGNYLTWEGQWGHGTFLALDDSFAVQATVDQHGVAQGRPVVGYALGGRTFHAGETLRYQYLIMRWPVGVEIEAGLDRQVSAALNLGQPDSGARVVAAQGAVTGTQVFLDLQVDGGAFRGTLQRADLGMRVPLRLAGLNANWTAGLWGLRHGLLVPLAPDPEGLAWFTLDPATESGRFFAGHPVTCNQPAVILRVLQRTRGGWDVLAHNPLARHVEVVLRGARGGPVEGFTQRVRLAPGEEVRYTLEGRR